MMLLVPVNSSGFLYGPSPIHIEDERGVETGQWKDEEIGHRQSETGGNRNISPVVTAPHLDATQKCHFSKDKREIFIIPLW